MIGHELGKRDYELTPDLPDGFQMTELGPLPKEWRVVRLGEIFDITQGKSLSAKQNKGERPRPFLRTSDVYWGYLDLSKLDVMDFYRRRAKVRPTAWRSFSMRGRRCWPDSNVGRPDARDLLSKPSSSFEG
jgi:hypothetical protein